MSWIDALVDRGALPDPVVRLGIRRLLRRRLREIGGEDDEATTKLLAALRTGPIAVATADANRQHYELPAEFFRLVLGRRLKYSGCYWPAGDGAVGSLDAAEEASLALTCRRAGLADGMEILELGCGWGSLTLWMAERYPSSRIVSVSNSRSQREFIEAACRERGLGNVEVVTADVNDFDPGRRFDRVVSVEMFEHMRNYRELLARIASWLAPEGRLFVHVFCHRKRPYLFENQGPSDWMTRHFFTGGLMPSADLFAAFADDLVTERRWLVDGNHYAKTARAWLANLDRNRAACREVLAGVWGEGEADRWLARWRVFFLACAELFAYRGGGEWLVSHVLLRPVAEGLDEARPIRDPLPS